MILSVLQIGQFVCDAMRVVVIDEGHGADYRGIGQGCFLGNQFVANQIANGLGAIGIALAADVVIEALEKVGIERDTNSAENSHGYPMQKLDSPKGRLRIARLSKSCECSTSAIKRLGSAWFVVNPSVTRSASRWVRGWRLYRRRLQMDAVEELALLPFQPIQSGPRRCSSVAIRHGWHFAQQSRIYSQCSAMVRSVFHHCAEDGSHPATPHYWA